MEKSAAEELRFDYLCGKCFSHASRSGRPGKVLSCCDFLCYDCGNGIQEPFTCPSCRKQNVKFVSTDDPSIPSEVARNISDPEDCIQQLKSVLLFQIKHYKTMLHRAVGKMLRDKKEFHRRLSFYENDGRDPRQNDGDLLRPQMPHVQTRQSNGENVLIERPRKMARPSTAGPMSSSTSGAWRSGAAPRSDRLGINETTSIRRNETGAQQGSLQRPATATSRTENSNRQGMSLGSLLDGRSPGLASESLDADRYSAKFENRSSQLQLNHGPGQPLETTHIQQYRNPSMSGQQQNFTPQIPSYAPSSHGPGQGPQRPMSALKVERPLTPSTLFLQNALQSQNFSRQNQQEVRQEQQGPHSGPGYGPGPRGYQGPSVPQQQQGYIQRPSTTPTPLSRLRSPHHPIGASAPRPRTPGTLSSGTIAVKVTQQM